MQSGDPKESLKFFRGPQDPSIFIIVHNSTMILFAFFIFVPYVTHCGVCLRPTCPGIV